MISRSKAFTLIELLIVVAIIAILAAIAIPNFLEAQIRAKVSREKNNMRSIATALESYKLDSNKYPMDAWWWAFYELGGGFKNDGPLNLLTTPVAYMSSIPEMVFYDKRQDSGANAQAVYGNRQYNYGCEGYNTSTIPNLMKGVDLSLFGFDIPADREPKNLWFLCSIGPDMHISEGSYIVFGEDIVNQMKAYMPEGKHATNPGAIYDPTNGTISNGDIVRVGP